MCENKRSRAAHAVSGQIKPLAACAAPTQEVIMDDYVNPPLLTPDLPGIRGTIKQVPEDFEVEEIPAYEASGSGDYLYIWIEKRGMGAEYFVRQLAQRLGIRAAEIGTAGLKDRHAVTRQWVSIPANAEAQLQRLEGDDIRVLKVTRHGNKLRPGHLRGNRFRILVRETDPAAPDRWPPILERLRQDGLPNYYGPQRFGHEGETAALGLALLRGDSAVSPSRRKPSPFLRKLALSAAQSALFNHYLGRRFLDGCLRRVLPGDVMAKWPFGGLFVAEDVAREQERFDQRGTVHAGPIVGRKTFAARGDAAAREEATLGHFGLFPAAFRSFGKLLQGTRRHNIIYVDDLSAAAHASGVCLSFTLPAGSYATVLLREVMKVDPASAADDIDAG
jgi:tRNA pseudouridine13 synthase